MACRVGVARRLFGCFRRAIVDGGTHDDRRHRGDHDDTGRSGNPPPTSEPSTTTLPPASTLVPVDPTVLVPIAVGNKAFPADADELVSQYHGYTGDPNATLQTWLISPMAVPSGPDVRLLGFERSVGINTTTATYLTGRIDPAAALAGIQATLAPAPTYTVTRSTRTEGSATIYSFDAQPTTVQGDPPGWTVEASAVGQLGIDRKSTRLNSSHGKLSRMPSSA